MLISHVKYFLTLLITFSFFSCSSINPLIPPLVNDTKPVWPQVGYNGRHTGTRYGISVNVPPVQSGNVYWVDTITTAYVNDGSEAACDALGNIYFRYSKDNYGSIIKYRPDGTRIWMRDSLMNDAYNGIALSSDETRIYYSDYSKFVCRDSGGNLVWSVPGGSHFGAIPCIGRDGTIYTSLSNQLAAVSPEGKIKWRLFESDMGTCWPALDRSDNIYVKNKLSSGQYELLKIDKQGSVIYRYRLND
jgi:hypothetical protein